MIPAGSPPQGRGEFGRARAAALPVPAGIEPAAEDAGSGKRRGEAGGGRCPAESRGSRGPAGLASGRTLN